MATDIFPPYIEDLVEVRAEQTSHGVDLVNVFFVKRAGIDGFEDEAAGLATVFDTFYETLAGSSLGLFWAVTGYVMKDRSEADGQEVTISSAVVGDEVATALPLQTQLCITWRCTPSGRRYRGRTYIAGWTEDSNDSGGSPNDVARGVVATAAADLITDLRFGGAAAGLQVLSRGSTAPPAPVAWEGFATTVQTASVDDHWDVLRSRRS